MKKSVKVMVVTAAVVVALVIATLVYVVIDRSREAATSAENGGPQVVRENSHVVDDAGPDAPTVVEFLDFECEACGAFYPVVEDLRERFAGEINYVIRYFPIPSHLNSTNAALAAEAAAQQGRFEDMYHRLFETQREWGEAQESRADVFRGYAEDLGLDMTAYDAAVSDPATLERVQFDFDEGRLLGVGSTPTFFVNDEMLVLEKLDDLEIAIRRAVDEAP